MSERIIIDESAILLMIKTLKEYDECLWGEWNGGLSDEQNELLMLLQELLKDNIKQ